MKKKVKLENLYVGCRVAIIDEVLELFEKYETFGSEYHHIIIYPKKLLVQADNLEGKVKYKLVKSDRVFSPCTHSSSYKSQSSAESSLYCSYIGGFFNPGITSINDEMDREYHDKTHKVGYLIPFKEHIHNTLGIKLENDISLKTANFLLSIANTLYYRKRFELNGDCDLAEKQLKKKVYIRQKNI